MFSFDAVVEFDWDASNARKNDKHGITQAEAEAVLLCCPLMLARHVEHSSFAEVRFHALAASRGGRRLHLRFTLQGKGPLIRVISARAMYRKERAIYDKQD